MSDRKQEPTVRLGAQIHAMVEEQVRAMAATGYTGSTAAFVKAGVLEMLKLSLDEQKEKAYAVQKTADEVSFLRRSVGEIRRNEPPLKPEKPASRSRAAAKR